MGLEDADGDNGKGNGSGVPSQQGDVVLKGMAAEAIVGGGSPGGVDKSISLPPVESSQGPGPLDGSSLAAAMHNQLSF